MNHTAPSDPLTIALWIVLKGRPQPILHKGFPDRATCERSWQRYGKGLKGMTYMLDGKGYIIANTYCDPMPGVKPK